MRNRIAHQSTRQRLTAPSPHEASGSREPPVSGRCLRCNRPRLMHVWRTAVMNAQERAALENFLDQLVQIHGVDKIAEADLMIRRALERQPDAAYLLVQRALLLGQALAAAKARIADLERGQAGSNPGFLHSGTSGWSAANQAPSAATPAPL